MSRNTRPNLSMGKRISLWTGLDSRELLLAALALIIILTTIGMVVQQIGKRHEQSIESSLATLLGSTDEVLQLWARDQKSVVKNLAEGGALLGAVQTLLTVPPKQADLLSSPAQGELRKLFQDYLKSRRFQGFFIISPANVNLASSRDRNVGIENLLAGQPDVLARMWQGETVIGRVMWSDVPLTSQQEADIGTRDMTMFVGTPIRDASDKVIALLTLRIDPNRALFPLLQHARLGKTGETYIFDQRGLLLSPVRFIDDLVRFGVIQPGQSSVLRIRIQDHSQSIPIEQRPLTRMAASAIQGQQGTDLSGYRDYRGAPVVGAWLWNSEMGVGLAAEQDVAEAKSALTLTTNLVYGAGGIASAALLLVLYAFGAGRRQLRETQSRLGAVVNSAVDSIVVIDTSGQIESVNPATETMFGYTAEWLVGRNVRELMPEPYSAEHDSYLARYLNTGEARVVGIGREVEARRADGSTFPVELVVNRLEMESGLHFAGVIRDVSRRKEAEAALEEERRFSQKALNALASHIAVLDETGRIVFVNDAWRKFAQENGLRDEQACLGQNYLEVSQSSRGLWSEEAPEVSKNLAAMLADEKESFVLEYPCHGPAGQGWFLLLASRFRLRGKAMVVMSHENITARRLAEDKLRQEKEATEASNRILSLTQTAMARSGIGEFWIHVQSGRFLRVSDRFCEDLGYSREELLSMSVFDVSRERSAKDFRQLVSVIQAQGWGRIESVYRGRDGRMIPVEVIIMYQAAELDRDDMLIAFSVDIAARKEAEEVLRRTSEELRMMSLVAAKTDNGVVLTDLDQRILWVNAGFTVISGYSLEEAIGRKPGEFLQGEKTNPETARRISEAVNRRERVEAEIVNYHKNGNPYWVHLEVTPVRNEAGEVVEFIALEQDVSARREAAEALWVSKERLEAAASAGIIGIWDWDVVNDRLVWDKVMYQLYGIREGDFGEAYEAWIKAVHPEDREAIDAEIQAALRGEREYAPQFRVVWPDGSVHFIKAASHTSFDDQGRPVRMIGVNYDLTEQKKTEQILAQASADAEAANRAKSAFLAMMSHEIRTPLNGIVGTIDLLGYDSLSPSQRNLVRTAKESSLALMTIIDDILDFSKIEAGRLALERTRLSLEDVVEGVAETLLPLASKKEVVLLVYADPTTPVLLGDPVRLRQILLNLVSNAIKFSAGIPGRAGLVEVEATPYSLTPGQALIRVTVRDNGIGMSPAVLKGLFQPFQQAETSTTRRFGGTGLGLVISRRLAELMGGDVAVQSLEGEGTVFTVTLAIDVAPASGPKPSTDLGGLMVLLVTGEPYATTILETYIRHSGAEVLALDSAEVLNRFDDVHGRHRDMVVAIECQGDEAASSRLCDRLREKAGNAPVRFLIISRGRRRQVRSVCGDAMTVDMNAMRRSVLINAVAALAGRESPELAPQELALAACPPAPTIEAAETAGQLILLAEDNETNQQVIRQQLGMLGYAVQVADNGRQALALWRQGRFALLLTDCHMPEMDGYDLTRAIRAEEGEGRRLPIIAITADALKGADAKCTQAGMDDYLTKPMQLEQLRTVMGKWLPLPVIRERPATSAPDEIRMVTTGTIGPGPSASEVVAPDALSAVLGTDDKNMLVRFYKDFLRTGTAIVEQIQSAYGVWDVQTLGKLAHKLKSSARTVGANGFADCCLSLEQAAKAGDAPEIALQMAHFQPLFEQVREWINGFVSVHASDE